MVDSRFTSLDDALGFAHRVGAAGIMVPVDALERAAAVVAAARVVIEMDGWRYGNYTYARWIAARDGLVAALAAYDERTGG